MGASLVHRAWLRAEAANPLQHSQLVLAPQSHQRSPNPADLCRLRWGLRDASRLLKMELSSTIVPQFLSLQPKLTRLAHLELMDWQYTYEQAEQLQRIEFLESLQVCHLLDFPCSVSSSCVFLWFLFYRTERYAQSRSVHVMAIYRANLST